MNKETALEQLSLYRTAADNYEALKRQIDSLLSPYQGDADQMPPDERVQYKALARRRDEILTEMRWLEQQLLDDTES